MNEPIRTEQLANGLLVEFHDQSNRYFGDYHRVRIEVRCRCVPALEHFAAAGDPAGELRRAQSLLGGEFVFTRHLEQMGVSGDRVEGTREELIGSFIRHSFPYLADPAFPARLLAREVEQRGKGRRPFGSG